MHLNHLCDVVVDSGKPTHVPEETVSSLPVVLVPVTTGFKVAMGGPVTTKVEAVDLTDVPKEFLAVI